MLEESEEQKTEIIKVDKSSSEDTTYRVCMIWKVKGASGWLSRLSFWLVISLRSGLDFRVIGLHAGSGTYFKKKREGGCLVAQQVKCQPLAQIRILVFLG